MKLESDLEARRMVEARWPQTPLPERAVVMVCRRCKLPLVQVGTNIWRHAATVERQMSGRDDARYWTCGTKPFPTKEQS